MSNAPGESLIRSPISPAHFFSSDDEKTKLNWFLFEFARELESFVRRNKNLCNRLNKRGVSRNILAGFCIHFSKHMKGEILAQISGQIPQVRMDHSEIQAYFPKIGDILVDELLTTAAKAWDSQTEACGMCPSRCISEKEKLTPMFDNPSHWD